MKTETLIIQPSYVLLYDEQADEKLLSVLESAASRTMKLDAGAQDNSRLGLGDCPTDSVVLLVSSLSQGDILEVDGANWFAQVSSALFHTISTVQRLALGLAERQGRLTVIWEAPPNMPQASAQCAIDGAMVSMVKAFALDLAPLHVAVNGIQKPTDVGEAEDVLPLARLLSSPGVPSMVGQILRAEDRHDTGSWGAW